MQSRPPSSEHPLPVAIKCPLSRVYAVVATLVGKYVVLPKNALGTKTCCVCCTSVPI